MPGETYADFAAGLRDVVGRNKVSERVLLAQFYRCLDKTTRKLVTQDPEPKTLEEAVDNASEIDYPMDNAARGMMNIGQPWATAPSPHLVPMTGTSGQTVVIPGIGGARLPAEMTSSVRGVTAAEHDADAVALFTNPQGVWNIYIPLLGTYRLTARSQEARKRQKQKREVAQSSSDESEQQPKRPKLKAAVKQAAERKNSVPSGKISKDDVSSAAKTNGGTQLTAACYKCGEVGNWSRACSNDRKCYACHNACVFQMIGSAALATIQYILRKTVQT
ncbi:hypothetical protein F441_11709 [Phytophthora nicotianae CJ01A1]|uniref:CCHC-type domain-containing protein n=1 Tax=Phytophthora nicotianae CJ01A1 TaxID=1317063 RepID=W2WR55_PHYNI|nr:hypothetical protein F441_11709 [Phytophthora nicotianae CJ01A1]